MIYPVIVWFKFVRYDDKRALTITNLDKTTWMSRYPRPIQICMTKKKDILVTSSENP